MKYNAVIFDLFGTLVDYLPAQDWQRSHETIAQIFSVGYDEFRMAWRQIMPDRDLGRYGGVADDFKHVCTLLGIQPSREQIDAAIEVRLDYYRRELQPRTGAIETLHKLRESGHKVGLITVCGSEIPMLWDESDFGPLMNACVFSCLEGITKPDPLIYQLACDRLGVKAEDCLYVGDGSSRELTGVLEVGMHPVLIQMEYDRDYGVDRIDAVEWQGSTIDSLSKVLELVV
ncbi:HAD hydrolase-like protein [bacterium]|nr:HAD hydrolase-like protein [bacterium]